MGRFSTDTRRSLLGGRESRKGRGEEEVWSWSKGEDSEVEEDAMVPRLETTPIVADGSREGTADSTENIGTEGSPERGRENGRSVRRERPPGTWDDPQLYVQVVSDPTELGIPGLQQVQA
jgi:hypothetical protein